MKYYCKECGKTLERDPKALQRDRKAGIKEYCGVSGKYVRLAKKPATRKRKK